MKLIIDGSQWIYIYSITQEPLYNVDFIDVSVVYYTLRKLYQTILQHQPDEVFIVFDIGRDLKKKKKFEQYKALRNVKSTVKGRTIDSMIHERIQMSRKLIHQILETTPVHSFLIPFIEGDTLLAFITKYFESEKKLIISNDKDMFQLLDENTRILAKSTLKLEEEITHKQIDRVWSAVVGKELLLEKLIRETNNQPISYKCIPYYRAFLGDSSDCIPGVKGVGASLVGYIIQYQQYVGKVEFTSPDDFFSWLKNEIDTMEQVYQNLTYFIYGKKRRAKVNFKKFRTLLGSDDVRNTWQVFFELMDFDTAISELSSTVYRTLLEDLRTERVYDEESFLQLVREYDLNSTSEYMKWHIVNKVLESKSSWNILSKLSTVSNLELLFNKLCNKCKYHDEIVQ